MVLLSLSFLFGYSCYQPLAKLTVLVMLLLLLLMMLQNAKLAREHDIPTVSNHVKKKTGSFRVGAKICVPADGVANEGVRDRLGRRFPPKMTKRSSFFLCLLEDPSP